MKKLKQVEPFAYGYMNSKSKNMEMRIAQSIYCFAQNAPLYIHPEKWFAGNPNGDLSLGIRYKSNYGMGFERFPALKNLFLSKQHFFGVLYLQNAMIPHLAETRVGFNKGLRIQSMAKYKNLWGAGSGHSNPDYKMLLELGTKGLRQKVLSYKNINSDKAEFYNSLILTLDAFELLANRYKTKAQQMLTSATKDETISLNRIINALNNVPQNPPRDFFEACQFFWLAFSFLEIDSPGLFDYTLGQYYENDHTGIKYQCLQKLWELFHETRTWNLCISGSDEFGNDLSNELTYDVLKVAREYKYNTPNITMRFHKNSPESAWDAAVKTLATGIGMPAIYNDECVCPAMEALNIPTHDAHLYCMNGCNQIDIFGKSHMGLEDGEINVSKALQYVLLRGRCGYSKRKFGLDLGDPEQFETFESFMQAFFKETDYMSDLVTNISNRAQYIHSVYSPNPWRSLMITGCVERGLDFKNKGPLYGHGQILTEGLPDAADSIAAIKHFIYDTKKYTISDLVRALKKDFKGYDELKKDFSTYHKFGNDIDDVDLIYSEITDHIYRYMLQIDTFRGGKFGVGCSTYNRAAEYGKRTGALPNGKTKKDTNFSESIGAVPGCDKNGPTALLNSVLKVDQTLAKSGNVLQIKFSQNQFNTPAGKEAFKALAKTYFRLKGQTLQINVVSPEELIDAKIHPEKHADLIVRVGGFSEYFVRLSPELQDNVINRTLNRF